LLKGWRFLSLPWWATLELWNRESRKDTMITPRFVYKTKHLPDQRTLRREHKKKCLTWGVWTNDHLDRGLYNFSEPGCDPWYVC
jgi:hypothetical protein